MQILLQIHFSDSHQGSRYWTYTYNKLLNLWKIPSSTEITILVNYHSYDHLWTVPKYRSTSVYTSSYIRHRTVQYSAQSLAHSVTSTRSMQSVQTRQLPSRVARRFGSDKLYICLSNKCFKLHPVYLLCTDIRPLQDHRILRVQPVWIKVAKLVENPACRFCSQKSRHGRKKPKHTRKGE